jgi:hypothetical protein
VVVADSLGVPNLIPKFEVLRQVLRGVPKRVGNVAHIVDGASERVDVIVRGVGIWWWHLLFRFSSFYNSFFFFGFLKFRVDFLLFSLRNIMQTSILYRE